MSFFSTSLDFSVYTKYYTLSKDTAKNSYLTYLTNTHELTEGSKIYSSYFKRDVALVTDELVFRKIFNNGYTNWTEFKKDMFN